MSDGLEKRVEALESDVSNIKASLQDLAQSYNALSSSVHAVETSKNSLEQRVKEFQADFAGMRADFRELMSEVTTAQVELHKLQQSMQHNLELLQVRFGGDINKLEMTMREFQRLKNNATKAMWTIVSLVVVDLFVRFVSG